MRTNQEKPTATPSRGPGYLGSVSAISLPPRCPSTIASEKANQTPYEGSIYSCNEDDKSGLTKDVSFSYSKFPEPPASRNFGDVTAMDQAALTESRRRGREISTASSVEWKTWLSANVAKLESPTAGTLRCGIKPTLGHVRENAEIEPSIDLISPVPSKSASTEVTPLRPVQSFSRENSQSPFCNAGTESEPRLKEKLAKLPTVPSKGNFRPMPSFRSLKAEAGRQVLGNDENIPHSTSFCGTAQSSPSRREELLLKRRSRMSLAGETGSSIKSSPSLTAAVERQFGKPAMTGSPAQRKY